MKLVSRFISCTFLIFFAALIYAIPPFKGHDPTTPSIVEEDGNLIKIKARYQLSSIIISPARRLALINNQLVHPGSIVDKAEVKAINYNYVILLVDNQSIKINLIDKTTWDSWR